ncbi:MAG: PCRF domain-containing protein [Saprospiraceae bacterium]|nr:PCRF domain-containing protein [Saprospiraceae bacterium]
MTIEQLQEVKNRLGALKRYLDYDSRTHRIEQKEQLTLDPNFWNDPKKAEALLKEISSLKFWTKEYDDLASQVEELEVSFEFYKEGEFTEEEVEKIYKTTVTAVDEVEFKSTLDQEEDELGCLLEINAGAGGTESCDWSEMLLRMYLMWSVTIEIKGDFAYGMLKGENGVHRLVRISPFNSQGKRMTSFSSVFVHPLIDNRIEVDVNPADLDWDTFRASGAGGQHVNKTESAVRVRHLPTGLVVECQQERSQHLNREKAITMLKSRIYELELQKKQAEREKIEAGKMKNEWGSQIRSYVLDDRRVKDHRTNHQTHDPDAVLNGELDGFLKAWLMHSN